MTKTKNPFIDDLPLYLGRYLNQLRWNADFQYYIVIATLLQAIAMKSISPWIIAFSLVQYWIVGLFAIGLITRKIDRAFQSLPLNYQGTGYGKPRWIIEGKHPLRSDTFKITSAGFGEEDFKQHKNILASRLRFPIAEIRKPTASDPHIYVVVKKSELPSHLTFKSLDLASLTSGEFYLGQSEDGLIKTDLTRMIHMLVAGQTGSGKTQFLKQLITTLLLRTQNIHLCLIDMKGGIDFQEFMGLKNMEIVTTYETGNLVLDGLNALFETRTKIILEEGREKWSEIPTGTARKHPELAGKPIGPIVLVVDELAELSKQATKSAANSDLQEKVARLARLARVTGIHLILGTQRPDVKVLSPQSRDNLPTKVCFSVPTIAASTIVVNNMSAATLGGHPGRAVVIERKTQIAQTPYLTRAELDERLSPIRRMQEHSSDDVRIYRPEPGVTLQDSPDRSIGGASDA